MFEKLGLNRIKPVGRKLDKKMFYDNCDMSKNDKKIFVDFIERIEMSYIVNSSNLNIQAYRDEEYAYEAIVYLKVRLKQDKSIDKISKIINTSIPNPLVIIYEFEKKYRISTAIKRISKIDKNKTVIEEERISKWLDIENLNKNETEFLNSISLSGLPYSNLFDFYKNLNDKIYMFENTYDIYDYKDIGDKNELEEKKNLLQEIESLEDDLKKILRKLKRESQFNKKMEFNVKATELKRKIDTLKSELK